MDTAALVRIFDANPTDEIVDKRGLVITALRDKLRATTKVASLLGHANCIGIAFSSGAMPEPLATEVEAAIRAESSAFVREGQDLQMLVCAIGASILQSRNKGQMAGEPMKIFARHCCLHFLT